MKLFFTSLTSFSDVTVYRTNLGPIHRGKEGDLEQLSNVAIVKPFHFYIVLSEDLGYE